jgi:hypothetical protein
MEPNRLDTFLLGIAFDRDRVFYEGTFHESEE